jgi:hypothetical protein
MGDVAYISEAVLCDFCKMVGAQVQAQYDGATVHGPWAYMCEAHFQANGVGSLGTGKGQRLIVGERPADQPYTDDLDEGDIPPLESPKPVEEPKPYIDGVRPKMEWPHM